MSHVLWLKGLDAVWLMGTVRPAGTALAVWHGFVNVRVGSQAGYPRGTEVEGVESSH